MTHFGCCEHLYPEPEPAQCGKKANGVCRSKMDPFSNGAFDNGFVWHRVLEMRCELSLDPTL